MAKNKGSSLEFLCAALGNETSPQLTSPATDLNKKPAPCCTNSLPTHRLGAANCVLGLILMNNCNTFDAEQQVNQPKWAHSAQGHPCYHLKPNVLGYFSTKSQVLEKFLLSRSSSQHHLTHNSLAQMFAFSICNYGSRQIQTPRIPTPLASVLYSSDITQEEVAEKGTRTM